MSFSCTLPKLTTFAAIALVSIAATGAARAQSATEIQLSYKDKKFDPAEISAASILRYFTTSAPRATFSLYSSKNS